MLPVRKSAPCALTEMVPPTLSTSMLGIAATENPLGVRRSRTSRHVAPGRRARSSLPDRSRPGSSHACPGSGLRGRMPGRPCCAGSRPPPRTPARACERQGLSTSPSVRGRTTPKTGRAVEAAGVVDRATLLAQPARWRVTDTRKAPVVSDDRTHVQGAVLHVLGGRRVAIPRNDPDRQQHDEAHPGVPEPDAWSRERFTQTFPTSSMRMAPPFPGCQAFLKDNRTPDRCT